jgi:O-acetyl-ADP-ribose deacetylase (regulator of RNase III)
MFARRFITMATRSVNDIPSLTQLYRDPESVLSAATPRSESTFPANDSINRRIGLIRGDITKLRLDAIVNAANKALRGGGGVDGAIHDAAGPGLLKECRPLGPIDTGEAVITKGYSLPAKHVIHTAGPIYGNETNPNEKLAMCYRECLKLAVENGVETVAFSAISTGIYGFPNGPAAQIACRTVREFLETEEGQKLSRVVFVTFVAPDVDAYNKIIPKVFPPANEKVTE